MRRRGIGLRRHPNYLKRRRDARFGNRTQEGKGSRVAKQTAMAALRVFLMLSGERSGLRKYR